MSISGFTVDSSSNGIGIVSTAKTGLTATVVDEVLCISGNGRLDGDLTINSSQISVYNPPSSDGPGSNSPLGNSSGIRIRNQSSILTNDFVGTLLRVYFIEFTDSIFICEVANGRKAALYVQNNGVFRNSTFRGVFSIETRSAPTLSGVSIIDSELGITTWDSGRLDYPSLNIPSTNSGYLAVLAEGATNSLYLWNPVAFDFTKILFTTSAGRGYWGYTATWKFQDTSGAVSNALLIYKDDRSNIGGSKSEVARYTSGVDGILEGTVNSKNGTTTSSQDYPTLWLRTRQTNPTGSTVVQNPQSYYSTEQIGGLFVEKTYTIQDVSVEIEVRSYGHLAPELAANPTSEIGRINADESVSFYQPFILVVDTGVTQTNTTTVSGYSGISNSTGSFNLSGTLTLSQVYDSRKLYWRNNDGVSAPSKVGDSADFGTCNITIAAPSNNPATTAKYARATLTGTLTLSAAGTYSSTPWDIVSTGIVVVAPGSTNLEGWTFESGATINVSSGTAIVTVDTTTGITVGSGVTLQVPQASVEAINFASGTRVQVSHRQVFTVTNTAINTSTNAITLGNDSNGDAPNFSTTTPNTLIRFSLNSGATIPTSSPQIIDGGLYYLLTNTSGVITLSTTEGGSAIDFTSQGTGNFTLIAETEKDNSVVSGGSGYEHIISLSSGSLVRVKARYWQNSSGCTASAFFDNLYSWSNTTGVSIPDVVSDTVLPDAIHNRIIGLTSLELPVSGSQTPTNDGSTVTGLSIAIEGTGKVQINSNDSDGVLLLQDLYAWAVYVTSTAAGIRVASSTSFQATDLFNFVIVNLEFDNTGSIPLRIIGGRVVDQNGATPIASTSASIFPNVELVGTGAIVSVDTGTVSPTAAEIRAAIGLASANLDGQIEEILSNSGFTGVV